MMTQAHAPEPRRDWAAELIRKTGGASSPEALLTLL